MKNNSKLFTGKRKKESDLEKCSRTMNVTNLSKNRKPKDKDLEILRLKESTHGSLRSKKGKELKKWLIERKDKDSSWT